MVHLSTLLQKASAQGARSSALHSLQWTLFLLVCSIIGCAFIEAPAWILVTAIVFFGITLILFISTYIFLLITDRDALRSETYSLSKLAIEQGLLGDDNLGLFDPDNIPNSDAVVNLGSADGQNS